MLWGWLGVLGRRWTRGAGVDVKTSIKRNEGVVYPNYTHITKHIYVCLISQSVNPNPLGTDHSEGVMYWSILAGVRSSCTM